MTRGFLKLTVAAFLITFVSGVTYAEEAPEKTKAEKKQEKLNEKKAARMLKELRRHEERRQGALKARAQKAAELKAQEEAETANLIKSREEARLLVAGISLPKTLELSYAWSFEIARSVKADEVWAIGDIILYVSNTTDLNCVRKLDGVALWTIDLDSAIQTIPTVTSDTIYVFVRNQLVAIDRFRGEIDYKMDLGFIFSDRVSTRENRLYVPATDGKLVAGYTTEHSTPLFTSQKNGYTTSYHEFNTVWFNSTETMIVGYPVVSNESIFVALRNGYAYSIDLDGRERFKAQTQGEIWAPIAVGPENVYVSADDFNVYAFGKLTGQAKWIFPTNSRIVEPVIPDRGFVFIPTMNNGIFCIKETTGAGAGDMLWHKPDALYIAGVSDTHLYAMFFGNRLAAIEKRSGNVMWMSMVDSLQVVPHIVSPANKSEHFRILCLKDSKIICLGETDELIRKTLKQRAR